MNLTTLKSLQSRIREATGADRELDFAICKTFKLGPLWCSRYITDPDDMAPRFTTDPDGIGACVALMREVLPGYWRHVFQSEPPKKVTSPSKCWFKVFLFNVSEGDSDRSEKGEHALETHATLLAIIAAKIAELEARETV